MIFGLHHTTICMSVIFKFHFHVNSPTRSIFRTFTIGKALLKFQVWVWKKEEELTEEVNDDVCHCWVNIHNRPGRIEPISVYSFLSSLLCLSRLLLPMACSFLICNSDFLAWFSNRESTALLALKNLQSTTRSATRSRLLPTFLLIKMFNSPSSSPEPQITCNLWPPTFSLYIVFYI